MLSKFNIDSDDSSSSNSRLDPSRRVRETAVEFPVLFYYTNDRLNAQVKEHGHLVECCLNLPMGYIACLAQEYYLLR